MIIVWYTRGYFPAVKVGADVRIKRKEFEEWLEYKEELGSMVIPQWKTMKELLAEYVALYGKDNWPLSTYDGNVSLINKESQRVSKAALKELDEKDVLGDEYLDYNLVMASTFGLPLGDGAIKVVQWRRR